MSQKPGFNVFDFERFFQQGIIVEIDLPHRKIVRRPPVGVHFLQLFFGKGLVLGDSCNSHNRLRRLGCDLSLIVNDYLGRGEDFLSFSLVF